MVRCAYYVECVRSDQFVVISHTSWVANPVTAKCVECHAAIWYHSGVPWPYPVSGVRVRQAHKHRQHLHHHGNTM